MYNHLIYLSWKIIWLNIKHVLNSHGLDDTSRLNAAVKYCLIFIYIQYHYLYLNIYFIAPGKVIFLHHVNAALTRESDLLKFNGASLYSCLIPSPFTASACWQPLNTFLWWREAASVISLMQLDRTTVTQLIALKLIFWRPAKTNHLSY